MATKKRFERRDSEVPRKACSFWRFSCRIYEEDGLYVCEVGDGLEFGFSDSNPKDAVDDAKKKLLMLSGLRDRRDAIEAGVRDCIFVSAAEYHAFAASPSPMSHVFS